MILNRQLTLTMLVAIAALSAGWYGLQRYFSLTTNFKHTQHNAFMRDVKYIHYDNHGQIRHQVSSPIAFHQADTDGLVLDHPQMVFYDEHHRKWTIHANKGESSKANSEILLSDHVEIEQQATDERPPLQIYTDNLTLLPLKRMAETHTTVKIMQPDGQVNAVGLQADFNTQSIKLLSKAQAVYYRQQPSS